MSLRSLVSSIHCFVANTSIPSRLCVMVLSWNQFPESYFFSAHRSDVTEAWDTNAEGQALSSLLSRELETLAATLNTEAFNLVLETSWLFPVRMHMICRAVAAVAPQCSLQVQLTSTPPFLCAAFSFKVFFVPGTQSCEFLSVGYCTQHHHGQYCPRARGHCSER